MVYLQACRRTARDRIVADSARLLTCDNYSTLFRNNFTMLAAVFTAGFAFEIGFNQTMNKVWDNNNRGRQWKDIRHKYVEEAEDDE
ncbi:ubiquinol-cytochrome C reductase, UQCRX/QCR9 like domain-containing protein [Cordyceps javanica]|uniref:Complex III subunit 9 n=1 Tax=Cordyceps javanica TaxID=43265 RepID=A0A545V1X1_9HYPO|nr:ubiquinol-cytochrome C reductase, UQCRX/QCR9 like domain-containing protein [Cordyceps javanica]